MNKEIKKQLLLSVIMLVIIISTMFFWYDNFMFHTYIKKIDYQYCLEGNNADVIVDGYQFFQNSQNAYFGNGRILSTQNNFFLKNDNIECVVTLTDSNQNIYQYKHQYKVRSSNEVCMLDQKIDEKKNVSMDIKDAKLQLIIKRKNKVIYDEELKLHKKDLVTYNGSNKNYTIHDVYVTDSWLKTGYFSTTIENLEDQYQKYSIDYVCLKDDQNEVDVNNYERIVHMTGDTTSLLQNENQQVCFYDFEGSLLEKNIKCVITLYKDHQDQNPLTFMINLHGTIKEGTTYE